MLWEIANTPHRLLGSMHHLPADFSMPDWFSASYKGIERFVFESDFRIQPYKVFGYDKTRSHLKLPGAAETYSRAKRLLNANGINVELEMFRPWKAANIFAVMVLKTYGFVGEHGADYRLRLLADEKRISAEFFETNTYSSRLTDNAWKDFQGGLPYFNKMLADIESGAGKVQQERLLRAWSSSDLAELGTIHAENNADFPCYAGVVLQRNREWVAVAKRLMQEQTPTLFVVGAFHTVGAGSFIENMKSEGFKFNFFTGK